MDIEADDDIRAMILRDMLLAYRRNLSRLLSFDPHERWSKSHLKAEHCFHVAHFDLYKALHTCTKQSKRWTYGEHFQVSADDEGGVHFCNLTKPTPGFIRSPA